MADWLVAIAKHQREVRAYDELMSAGYVCYQPRFREKTMRHGRRVWVERLLLGRYILVEFIDNCVAWFARLCAVDRFRFVHGVLSADERPLVARGAEVMRMRSSEVRGFVPVSLTQPRRGDRGQIMRGAFVGHTARFDGRDDDRGVDHVLVDAFGQLTPIELPIGAWAA